MSGIYNLFCLETGILGGSISFEGEPPSTYGNKFVVKGEYDADIHYFNGTMVTLRPDPGIPDSHTVAANEDWHLPDMPAGTDVFIDDVLAGTTDEVGLTLSFPEARQWRVFFRTPLPWKRKPPITVEVV